MTDTPQGLFERIYEECGKYGNNREGIDWQSIRNICQEHGKRLADAEKIVRHAKAVNNHWNEFGPEHGFDEQMDYLDCSIRINDPRRGDLQVQACRPEDREMLKTPEGREMVSKAVEELRAGPATVQLVPIGLVEEMGASAVTEGPTMIGTPDHRKGLRREILKAIYKYQMAMIAATSSPEVRNE